MADVQLAPRPSVLNEPPDDHGEETTRPIVRSLLARMGASKPSHSAVLDPLLTVVRSVHPKADLALIDRAYRTAEHYHAGQVRTSGEPYITHPLAVTTILAELGMTEATLCAALLHDTVEDTSYTLEQLRADFGDEIAGLVDGVTKLDKVQYGATAKAETLRKMVIAMSRDIRVLLIKLADRLHNMRTIGYLRPDKRERIANETLEIFAPLAHRLGMNTIKWELEDLAFHALQPKVYDEVVNMVSEAAPERERQLAEVIDIVRADLAQAGITATVYGRPKHYYSIYQKMVVRGRDFKDIYDLVGVRILVDSIRDCYAALGVMHHRWSPLPGRFKDYIALPKFNMYQSLHTTVLGPGGRPVELQIRTQDMHQRAEYGVAAHWKYKQTPGGARGNVEAMDFSWVHQLSEWTKEADDPSEFLDTLRFEITSDEVYVFTPKGDVVALPTGSTPVDMAYEIHTEVGNRCIGARVNGRLVPLETKLNSGDQVEILTTKAESAGPSRDWLGFVASPRAKAKIRQYFTRERREDAIEQGKETLAKTLRKTGLPLQRLLTVEHLTAVAAGFRVPDVNALYAGIGEGTIGAQAVVQRLIATEGGTDAAMDENLEDKPILTTRPSRRTTNDAGVIVEGDSAMWVKLARCCTPLPGDEILGFITRENGVSVHRTDCTNVKALRAQPERIVSVEWAPTATSAYDVSVQIEGLDQMGLLQQVTKVLLDLRVNITAATVTTTKDRIVKMRLTLEAADPQHLQHVLASIKKVPGVYDIFRIKQ